jgi:hypothetical protein
MARVQKGTPETNIQDADQRALSATIPKEEADQQIEASKESCITRSAIDQQEQEANSIADQQVNKANIHYRI